MRGYNKDFEYNFVIMKRTIGQNNEIQYAIIQKIKALRIEHNISQTVLSEILGISSGQVGNIESSRFPHKYTLKQIYSFCSYIDYPVENIFLSEADLKSFNKCEQLIKKIIEYDG